MRRNIVFVLLVLFTNALHSPGATPETIYSAQLKHELEAVRDAALVDNYAYQELSHLTDQIGGRPTGSHEAEAAVEYVAGEMRHLGLAVRLEDVQVPHWVRATDSAELVEYPGQPHGSTQKIFITALGGNTPTAPNGIIADVVVVASFDELKALGADKVRGKIVLFDVAFDQRKAAAGYAGQAYGEAVAYRLNGAKEAAALGAVAVLIRSVGGADYRLPHTGFSAPAGIPAGAVASEDAGLIARLAAIGKVRMHLVLMSENGPDVTSHNVIADLRGAEHPEQVVIVSGHLDSWDLGTGAIDDGAGVAIAMETAELVQQLHLKLRRTIRVVAWMDEENGGRGSEAYGHDYQAEFGNYVAAIESDLGAAHPLGFEGKITPEAQALLRPVQDILQKFGASVINLSTRSPGADIAVLAKAGVPTFGIMQDGRTYFNYHHSAADTLDKVVPQELRENAAAMAVMAVALADLPEALPR